MSKRSPIEDMLWHDLANSEDWWDEPEDHAYGCIETVDERRARLVLEHGRVSLTGTSFDPRGFGAVFALRHVEFIGYQVDILITDGRSLHLAIECDGHDWHERTKQQASYDRARDRAMLVAGVPVIRFTGSDIHRDARQCANECINAYFALMRRWEDHDIAAWSIGYDLGCSKSQDVGAGSTAGLVG